ncbi:MAG: hypothetical protein ABIS51_14130 [Sphingomonas sp.]
MARRIDRDQIGLDNGQGSNPRPGPSPETAILDDEGKFIDFDRPVIFAMHEHIIF